MKMTYDPEADSALVYLVERIDPGDAPGSLMCDLEVREGAVVLLLDVEHRVLGFEILGASRLLPPEVLRSAQST